MILKRYLVVPFLKLNGSKVIQMKIFLKFVIAQYVGKTGAPGTMCNPQYHIDDPSCFVHCFCSTGVILNHEDVSQN